MSLYFEDLEEFRFWVVKGANSGSKIDFKPGMRTIGVGRAVDNDIVISDPTVSRHHARIDIRADGCWIADAGSSVGVEKMGFKVGTNPEPLASGDEFKIGDTILKFEIVAKKGAQKRAVAREAAEKAEREGTAKPPGPSLFERIGLGSRRTQLLAVATLVVLGVIFLWPEAKHLPPQATGLLTINYDSVFGYLPQDRRHLDKAVFEIPGNLDGLVVYFDALAPSGLEIRIGNRTIASLPKDPKQQSYELLVVPKAFGQDPTLLLTFDNLGYAPSDGDVDPNLAKEWGLTAMWMVRIPTAASSPGQITDDFSAQRAIVDRLQDDLSNRYKLVRAFRTSEIGLMKVAGRSFLLIPLPAITEPTELKLGEMIDGARDDLEANRPADSLAKVTKATQGLEQALARDLRMQLNAATLAGKRGAVEEQGRALAIATRTFPESTDPRYRRIQSRVRQLGGGALGAYNEALTDFGH